ncbi:hypothetical protein HETIRDRAFT_54479 [Heterobasidion irregulare TC 32-1]|uniref:non-specific serine/threonine protein kinase n=1 Tax=Heterobasidion irregulare (strain TC 32-1) TaxID=747525 RepID=W4KC28_HETIT|nr:uncharacterized protein HETIRDRAFT_54479 [Heterobasidion irregulare TC 32-1]ETW82895.1 hypothetical protein HETIRDRAFT_54479 [Heterobasidion irregulare TC 32-1]
MPSHSLSVDRSAISSSAGSVSGFPEEDLREGGPDNLGYFPARLGHPLEQGRYRIIRKSGWGQYSSVWLAKDKKYDRFVPLKILTCEATKAISGAEQRSDELQVLIKIMVARPLHHGFKHNLALYDSSEFKGPHGTHLCLVTEVLGFSLDYLRKNGDDGDCRHCESALSKEWQSRSSVASNIYTTSVVLFIQPNYILAPL